MDIVWQIVVILAVAAGTFAADYQCSLEGSELDCTEKNLTFPPPGYWPGITALSLNKNPITQFPKNSFSGFPDVIYLDVEDTLLRELDLGEFAVMSKLTDISLQGNKIETIIPSNKSFDNLRILILYGNSISTLDPNFILNAPRLYILSLNENPLEVIPGQPVVNHTNVQYLWVGMGSSIGQLDSTILSGVPNLEFVSMPYGKITNISGALVNNKLLKTVYLTGNAIPEITSNSFPSEGLLNRIDLSENPLKRLDTAAVNKAIAAGGYLLINDTPLACDCGFEALFWWAAYKGVSLNTQCSGTSECFFSVRHSASSANASSSLSITQFERDVLGKNIRTR